MKKMMPSIPFPEPAIFMDELFPRFRLHWVNRGRCEPSEFPVILECFSFVLATGGSCVYRTAHGRFEVEPGMLYCSFPNLREVVHVSDSFDFIHLFFEGDIGHHPFAPCGVSPRRPTLRLLKHRLAEDLMEEILNEYRETKRVSSPSFFSRVYRLLELAADRRAVSRPARARRNLVEEARRVFDAETGSHSSVLQIARALRVSPQSLLAACQRDLGSTTQEFLAELRLRKAKRLLKNTSHKLTYVAVAAGYKEEKYFLHCFKQAEGVTPSQWRALHGHPPAEPRAAAPDAVFND